MGQPLFRRVVVRTILAASLVLVLAAPAAGQTLTGVISGTVRDVDGAGLPGVTVTIHSAQLITESRTAVTASDGLYRFPNLPPGTYDVEFRLEGFATSRHEGVRLSAGSTATADAIMQLSGFEETVMVTGRAPLVDITSSQTLETFGQELVQNIPTSRTYVDILHLLPGISDSQYSDVGPGGMVVHGGTSQDVRLNIDGANASNAEWGYPTTDLSYEVVQEFQAVTTGVAAEFGGASDGVFNVITKSGGNDFSGSAYYYHVVKGLQAENISAEHAAQGLERGTSLDKDTNYGLSLGGPIWRNRAWFFANYDRKEEQSEIINFPVPQDVTQNQWFGKISAQPATRHRLSGFAQLAYLTEYPFIPQAELKDDKVYRIQDHNNRIFSGSYTGLFSDTTYLDITANRTDSDRDQAHPNANPGEYGYTDLATRDIYGGPYRATVAPESDLTRQVKGDLSHFAKQALGGSHDVKIGASWDIHALDGIRAWEGARVHQMFNGEPFRIQLANTPVTSLSYVRTIGLYAQDQWTIDRLTLNLGVRYDSSHLWIPEGSSGGDLPDYFPRQSFPRREFGTLSDISPRLGLAYLLPTERATVLTANFSRNYAQVRPPLHSGLAAFSQGTRTFEWTDPNGDGVWQPGEEGRLISDSTGTTSSELDPDLKNSHWDAFTVGVRREISDSFRIGATAMYRKQYNIIDTINRSLPFDEAYNPVMLTNPITGEPITVYALRPEFVGVPPSFFITNPDSSLCTFCPDLERDYRAIEVSFEKRMDRRWQLSGSYTLAHARGNKGTHHRTAQGRVYTNPNSLVNAFGDTAMDRRHTLKLFGTYVAPYDVWLSLSYTGQSGAPLQRDRAVLGPLVRFTSADSPLIQFEGRIDVPGLPPGTERMDARHVIDFRAEKRFSVANTGFIGLIVDVQNAFNANAVNFDQDVLITSSGYGVPGSLVFPRNVRIAARFEF